MGFLSNLIAAGQRKVNSYTGDKVFLTAVCSAAALVIAADGNVEESELEAAVKGMQSNPTLSKSYSGADIDNALNEAIINSKTRAGRQTNIRRIEEMATRPATLKQDLLLIAADTSAGKADGSDIGEAELAALNKIGTILSLNVKSLLGL